MFRKTGYAALLLLFAMAFAACSGSKEHGSAGTTPSDNGEQSTNEQGEALELPDVQYNDIVRVYVKGGDYADEIYPTRWTPPPMTFPMPWSSATTR